MTDINRFMFVDMMSQNVWLRVCLGWELYPQSFSVDMMWTSISTY